MTKIKTVSLCEATSKVADNIPNFSAWVRAKLLDTIEPRVWVRMCPECGGKWQTIREGVDRDRKPHPRPCTRYLHYSDCKNSDFLEWVEVA